VTLREVVAQFEVRAWPNGRWAWRCNGGIWHLQGVLS
jgi:hypothetical protein